MQEAVGIQPGLGEGGQHQRPGPQQEAGEQAGQRAGASPPRQYMPPSMAGANCATAAKLIRPMLTSA